VPGGGWSEMAVSLKQQVLDYETMIKIRVPSSLKKYVVGNLIPSYIDLESRGGDFEPDGLVLPFKVEWKYQTRNTDCAKDLKICLECYHDTDTKFPGWCSHPTSKYLVIIQKGKVDFNICNIFVLDFPALVKWWNSDQSRQRYWSKHIINKPTRKGDKVYTSSYYPVPFSDFPRELFIAQKWLFDIKPLFQNEGLARWL
jgi:hypothetical protein